MRVEAFDFELPKEKIALRPARPRDSARLLQVGPDGLTEHLVSDLPGLLRPDDCLVLNDTRVIRARLSGRRIGRGNSQPQIEVTLHQRRTGGLWTAFAKPGRKLKPDDVIRFAGKGAVDITGAFDARVLSRGEGGEIELCFELEGPALDAAIASAGVMPLPPYIASRRPVDARDDQDYQSVYGDKDGAVAAPTAGLHFTDELFARLNEAGIGREFLTLHVGAGTFLPVKVADTTEHRMHSEFGEISADTAERLNACRAQGGRIVAVGTTSLRLLESAAADGELGAWSGKTDIFITPGYSFKAVDMLITNFHLPRSTLFMLVSAFCGLDRMRDAYAYAIANDYRFYSYGDACLLHLAGSE